VRQGRQIVRVVLFWIVASTAAWLVSAPLIARWFNIVAPVGLLANLLVIPAAALVLLAGCLSIIFGLFFPLLGEIFNFANLVLVSALISFTGLIARIPYSHFFVQSPPLWSIAIWFGTLCAWILGKKKVMIAGVVCLAAAASIGIMLSSNKVTCDILNSGRSSVCLVNVPGSDDILINAGSRFNGWKLLRYLRSQGVDRLQALVITRADARHAGGAPELLRNISVNELWCSSTNMRSKVFRSVIAKAKEKGIAIRVLANGDTGTLRGNLVWKVLHPERQPAYRSADEGLLIMSFKRGKACVLLTSKLSALAESRLIESINDLRAEVIVQEGMEKNLFECHESELLQLIQPEWRIFCTASQMSDDFSEGLWLALEEGEQMRDVSLGPDMGIRIHLNGCGVRLERFLLK